MGRLTRQSLSTATPSPSPGDASPIMAQPSPQTTQTQTQTQTTPSRGRPPKRKREPNSALSPTPTPTPTKLTPTPSKQQQRKRKRDAVQSTEENSTDDENRHSLAPPSPAVSHSSNNTTTRDRDMPSCAIKTCRRTVMFFDETEGGKPPRNAAKTDPETGQTVCLQCFESKHPTARAARRTQTRMNFCKCGISREAMERDKRPMIECCVCHDRFHPQCIGVSESNLRAPFWACPRCETSSTTNTTTTPKKAQAQKPAPKTKYHYTNKYRALSHFNSMIKGWEYDSSHKFVGRRVFRVGLDKNGNEWKSKGTVLGCYPATVTCSVPLWHIRHDDGDVEAVNLSDTSEAIYQFQTRFVQLKSVDDPSDFADQKRPHPTTANKRPRTHNPSAGTEPTNTLAAITLKVVSILKSKFVDTSEPTTLLQDDKANNQNRSAQELSHLQTPANAMVTSDTHRPRGLRNHTESWGKVYCVCHRPYSVERGFMLACDTCEQWFHGACVGVTMQQAKKLGEFECPLCRKMPIDEEAALWDVCSLLDARKLKGGRDQVYVRWQGFGPEWDTWEDVDRLKDCDALVKDALESFVAEAPAKSAQKEDAVVAPTVLSDYEKMRLEKVERNRAFLMSLNIANSKLDVDSAESAGEGEHDADKPGPGSADEADNDSVAERGRTTAQQRDLQRCESDDAHSNQARYDNGHGGDTEPRTASKANENDDGSNNDPADVAHQGTTNTADDNHPTKSQHSVTNAKRDTIDGNNSDAESTSIDPSAMDE